VAAKGVGNRSKLTGSVAHLAMENRRDISLATLIVKGTSVPDSSPIGWPFTETEGLQWLQGIEKRPEKVYLIDSIHSIKRLL
jgi:hypothetical protein